MKKFFSALGMVGIIFGVCFAARPAKAMISNDEKVHKVTFVGDVGVGKHDIIKRLFAWETCNDEPTEWDVKVSLADRYGSRHDFWLLDTASEEKYKCTVALQIKNTDVAVLVYNIKNKDSRKGVLKWKELLDLEGRDGMKVILVANKIDLLDENCEDDSDNILESLHKEIDSFKRFTTSAITGEGIMELGMCIADIATQNFESDNATQKGLELEVSEKRKSCW